MVNQVTLSGQVVTEISLRQSKAGVPVSDFRIKHKTRRMPNPLFIDVEVWGAEAERVAEYVTRGDRIIVAKGELRCDMWEKDGQKRSKIKITAGRIILVRDMPYKSEDHESGEAEETSF